MYFCVCSSMNGQLGLVSLEMKKECRNLEQTAKTKKAKVISQVITTNKKTNNVDVGYLKKLHL